MTRRDLARWVVVVTLGESLGFTAPAAVGALATTSPLFAPLLLAAGAAEGALLGIAQVLVIRRLLPTVSARRWIVLTATAAVVAYGLALVPSSTAGWWTTLPPLAQGLFLGAVILPLLLSLGFAQWLELRHHVNRAVWWIAGTAAAWLVGLAVFLAIATPLWQEGQPLAITLAVGVAAGFAMAIAMATVTGFTLMTILRRQGRDQAADVTRPGGTSGQSRILG